MILQVAPEEFIIGKGVKVTFAPADGKGKVGIDSVQEDRSTKRASGLALAGSTATKPTRDGTWRCTMVAGKSSE